VNGASYLDITQGGDTCWINASIAASLHGGEDLSQRITYVGNDTYQVSLYNRADFSLYPNGYSGDYVEWTEYVHFNGDILANDAKVPVEGESWALILQRGVIQAVGRWDSSQTIVKPHSGGASDAFAMLFGTNSEWKSPTQFGSAEEMTDLIAFSGQRLVAHTKGMTSTLVAGHAYAVLGMIGDQVLLWNPWGVFTTVSWGDFQNDVGSVVINS
jgi:hypothetical protein